MLDSDEMIIVKAQPPLECGKLKIILATLDHFHQNEFKFEILFLHIERDQIVNQILNMTLMN